MWKLTSLSISLLHHPSRKHQWACFQLQSANLCSESPETQWKPEHKFHDQRFSLTSPASVWFGPTCRTSSLTQCRHQVAVSRNFPTAVTRTVRNSALADKYLGRKSKLCRDPEPTTNTARTGEQWACDGFGHFGSSPTLLPLPESVRPIIKMSKPKF